MTKADGASAELAITQLILAVFKLNGRLVAAGDRLVGTLGLTSARWQVLGALVLQDGKATASDAARVMGLTRQSVQRLATAMIGEGLIEPTANPRHVRAPLLKLSSKGKAAYAAAARRQSPWARTLAEGVPIGQLASTEALILTLASCLEEQAAADRAQRQRGRALTPTGTRRAKKARA
ncbi:MAG: helix-turn-helix domain-containing protein [Vicinamibacterales bacterium]